MKNFKFATGNPNKLREAREILGFEIEQVDIDLDEVQSIEVDKVVLHKAKEAYEKTGKAVIVEDVGFHLEAWNGLPGALIKWFLKTVGCDGILKMMKGYENRKVTARAVVGFWDGEKLVVGTGEVSGRIADDKKGSDGFGFDSIFIPDGHNNTFAEMPAEDKNKISMRKLAFEDLKRKIGIV